MLITRVIVHKLRNKGIPFVVTSKDMTNAFPSPKFDEMEKPLEKRLDTMNHELFQQRRRNQVTRIEARDGTVEIRLGSGGMQGDGRWERPG